MGWMCSQYCYCVARNGVTYKGHVVLSGQQNVGCDRSIYCGLMYKELIFIRNVYVYGEVHKTRDFLQEQEISFISGKRMERALGHVQFVTFRHCNAEQKIIWLVIKQRALRNKQRHNISIMCCKQKQGYVWLSVLQTPTALFIFASLKTRKRAACCLPNGVLHLQRKYLAACHVVWF